MQIKQIRGHLFEIFLAIAIIAMVVMMVVPLTPWLLDLLIGMNIGLSVLMIALALFVKHPLSFTAFPTLLLIATLYRLALNVSSTRLILLNADAGRVIAGFGGVVVGGDILVGACIFGILAMVLFLVITKGAQRVAEVAARFTLDALPGMQLAIDSDLRSGALSSAEASTQRARLDRQSRYYGSLDGAMKFVRGDAVAGLVIICVNIVGGLAIGIGRKGMSLEEALDTYTRLTIGDGLVTMLPALFISTAAGLLVTRVGQGDDGRRLGEQLGLQMFAEPRALAAAALSLFVLSIVPGLPFWPFVIIGALLGIGSAVQFRVERRRRLLTSETGSTPMDEGLFTSQIEDEISSNPSRLVRIDEVQILVDMVARTRPILVRETVPKLVKLPLLADLLRELVKDGISLNHLSQVLEIIARSPSFNGVDDLLLLVRRGLSSTITGKLLGKSGRVEAATLGPDIESVLETSLTASSTGSRLVLGNDVSSEVVDACKHALKDVELPVLIVKPNLRGPLAALLANHLSHVSVVAHGEIEPDATVDLICTVEI